MVDCSPEGLAFVADEGFDLGSVLKLSLVHNEHKIDGAARVQTVKVLGNGKSRYGLLVATANVNARKSLLKMTMEFQRTQLRRLAGAA